MTLEQMILSELQLIDLNGIEVLRVISKPEETQIIFEMPPAVVEFVVNDDYHYRILKVTYQYVVYQNPEYLSQFNHIVSDVIQKVKPIEMNQREVFAKQQAERIITEAASQNRLVALKQREQKIGELELLLEKKEQEIKVREEMLDSQEQALALKRATVAKEKSARKILSGERVLQKIKKHTSNMTGKRSAAVDKETGESEMVEDVLDAYLEPYGDEGNKTSD